MLEPGDELLLVGWPAARRALDTTCWSSTPPASTCVTGRRVPSSWIWRKLTSAEETQVENVGRP